MVRTEKRSRWRRTGLVFVLVVLGVVLYGAWRWLSQVPLAPGFEAYDRGDWATASQVAVERLQGVPNDPEALRLLARATFRLGRDEEARALYRQLDGGPMQAEDYYLLGQAMRRVGDLQVTLTCWEAARNADPTRTDILNDLGLLYVKLSRFSQASATAAALAGHPGWQARASLIFGQTRLGLGEFDGAADALEQALTRDPEVRGAPEPAAYYRKLLARARLQTGKPVEARAPLRQVLAGGPDPEASWLLSRAALQEGAWTEAAEALKASGSYRHDHPLEPEPAPYVGATRCARCHRQIHDAQQSSRHALTFLRGSEVPNKFLPDHPQPDPQNAKITHRLKRNGSRLRFETQDGDKLFSTIVEFAFGSGDRGLTLVGKDPQGRTRECRLSRYADLAGWDVTTGQPPQPPSEEGYLGRLLSPDIALLCLDCHTTRASAARDSRGPESADRGIGCERCHGPGAHHVRAVEAEFADLAIARPRAVPGGRSIHLCQQCHRSFPNKVERTDPNAVRFAATSLAWSSCYSASGGAIDCVTCHEPHHNAETTPAYYEAKCLACHSASKHESPDRDDSSLGRVRRASSCPVNPREGCLPCHMPAVKSAVPHATFADHNIRVHREASGRP